MIDISKEEIGNYYDGTGGRLAENILFFCRVLRTAGLPVGPGKVFDAVRAVELVGLGNRADFYWVLHSIFVTRYEERHIFNQAFHIFWKNPKLLAQILGILAPKIHVEGENTTKNDDPISRRVLEALSESDTFENRGQPDKEEIEFDATLTYSSKEVLQEMDFEQMTSDEITAARKSIAQMRLPIMEVPVRRFKCNPTGENIDMRSTLRASLRSPYGIDLKHRSPRLRRPQLIMLCDISGSMSRYSRMFLHFMHAITNDRDRVQTFVFGTRLTNITRQLKQKDIDIALSKVAGSVYDWSGGTRIGECIKLFNRRWTRRISSQDAIILIISDGLDRDAGDGLEFEMKRLHRSCRRLIWLNPLLRYDGFEPRSLGIRAMLPHVDEFRTVHNLRSLEDLTKALSYRSKKVKKQFSNRMEATL